MDGNGRASAWMMELPTPCDKRANGKIGHSQEVPNFVRADRVSNYGLICPAHCGWTVPLPPRRCLLVGHNFQTSRAATATMLCHRVAPTAMPTPTGIGCSSTSSSTSLTTSSVSRCHAGPTPDTSRASSFWANVSGTFITEWDKGAEICREMFTTHDSAQMYAERLAELAATLGFDGFLINIEVKLDVQFIDNLKESVNHQTKRMLYV